jgi:hypothetical protein
LILYTNFIIEKAKYFSKIGLDVDNLSFQLFEEIYIQQCLDTPFTISDAMRLNGIPSPATIHRKIQILLNRF